MTIEEHHLEELKHVAQRIILRLGSQERHEYQVSNLLHYCLRLLNYHDATRNSKKILVTCMGEKGRERNISSPLPERDLCQANEQKCMGKEFKMTFELGIYEMDGFMLDLGSDVNIIPNKY
jgi:hypothetical protein